MPPVIVAVAAAVASWGAAEVAVALGIVEAGSLGAALIGATAGLVVSYVGSMLLGSMAEKPSLSQSALDQKRLLRSSVEPRRVVYGRARVSGPIVYAVSTGPDLGFLHLVIALTGHEIDAVETVWINDVPIDLATEWNPATGEVTSGPFGAPAFETGRDIFSLFGHISLHGPRSRVFFRPYLGNQTAADPTLMAESPDGWDSRCILQGVAYLYVRLEYDKDLFQNGIPNISATIRGKKVYDPRTGTTAWSDNWALCVLDYLRADYGLSCADDELDMASFIAAANLSDETVPLNADGSWSQPRYRLNGTFQLDEKPIDIMEGMLAAGAGALTYVAGRYVLYGGAYIAPTATLTVSDFAGPVELQTMPRRADLFNGIKGTFIDPARYWQPSEFPGQQDSNAVAADGEAIWKDIELRFVTDSMQAQRLALQMLKRSRNPLTFKAPLRYEALTLKVWDTVAVTIPDFGWENKPFRIMSWSFSPAEGTCTATFQEEQVAAYAWTWEAAANVPDVPDTTLIDPLSIPVPTGITLVSTTAVQADGTVVPAIEVTWSAVPHAFVTAYEVQWREAPDGPWNSREVAAPTTRLVIAPVISGQGYDVQVRAVAGLVRSLWSGTSNGLAGTDTTPPGVPTGLAATGTVRAISVTWTLPADLDMAAVEVYEATSSDPAGRVYVGESLGSGFLRTGLSFNTTRWYWVRARDRSGNHSAFAGPVSATTSSLIAADLAQNIIDETKIARSLLPPVAVETLPPDTDPDAYEGRRISVAAENGRLYKYIDGHYVPEVHAEDIAGKITAGQIEVGAVGADQIATHAISAVHLVADEAVITEAAQIEDLTVGTLHIKRGNITQISTASAVNNISVQAPPFGGAPYNAWGLCGITVVITPDDDARMVVVCDPNQTEAGVLLRYDNDGGGGGGDGGSGAGGGE